MSKELPDILPLRPYFREMVWGGRRLEELYGKPLPQGRKIGESFELSAYPERESRVAAGPLAGRGLKELVEERGEQLVGERAWARCQGRFPLLVKLLDAWQDLSVQVHPGDEYAQRRGLEEGGKMEAWYVLRSEGGRVAHGLKEGVGRQDFIQAVEAGRVEEVIRFFPVRPGEVVCLPPGTVHALGAGVVLYEVQQASDLTFRIHDYHRPGLDGKPRPLHVEQALEVIDFKAALPGPMGWRELPGAGEEGGMLVDCEHFHLHLRCLAGSRVSHRAAESFQALTVVQGKALVRGQRQECALGPGDTALVPAQREFAVERQSQERLEYLLASPLGIPEFYK
jgi:mannose-6-phosphate isomerase